MIHMRQIVKVFISPAVIEACSGLPLSIQIYCRHTEANKLSEAMFIIAGGSWDDYQSR